MGIEGREMDKRDMKAKEKIYEMRYDWLVEHAKADLIICEVHSKEPVLAIYRCPVPSPEEQERAFKSFLESLQRYMGQYGTTYDEWFREGAPND